jgi:hypothetical protein
MSEREFWVVYDYGMGGVWGVARARSEADVLQSFPELEVVSETPVWMTEEFERKVRSVSSFAVSQPATYPDWLHALIDERGAP